MNITPPTRFMLTHVEITKEGPQITLRVVNPNPAEIGIDVTLGIGDRMEVFPATVSVIRG